MLSGGWDSRVILAALAGVSDGLVTITHGAAGHRELDLARQLAAVAGARHVELALGPDAMGRPDDLNAIFETTESLLFPWWRFAGRTFREVGCTVAFSGLLGRVLVDITPSSVEAELAAHRRSSSVLFCGARDRRCRRKMDSGGCCSRTFDRDRFRFYDRGNP